MSFQNVPFKSEFDYNGQKLTLESGLLAQQATSSVLATLGKTSVLAAIVVGSESSADYFPLQVIYEERFYASGKIKDSLFTKREAKPTDRAVLTGRLIDRSLRSLFNDNIRNSIQVVITVLSIDRVNPPDTLSVIAASCALGLLDFEMDDSAIETEKMLSIGTKHSDAKQRDGVAAVIFNPTLQKYGVIQAKAKNYFQLAAGGIDAGEESEVAALREAQEETGISKITQVYSLGKEFEVNFYHEVKQLHRTAISKTFLMITAQEIPGEVQQEAHENFTFSWQDSNDILESLKSSDNADFVLMFKEQFGRGVSKAIQLGLDVISDPNTFNKQFANDEQVDLFKGAIGSVRIGRINDQFVVNPNYDQMQESELDLVVSGDEQSIMMLEAGANIIPENIVGEALDVAMPELAKLINYQKQFIAQFESVK